MENIQDDNQQQLNENIAAENTSFEQARPIDQEKLNLYIEKIRLEQNLPFGVTAGIAATLVSAALWAVITVATEYQIGYMAVGVGLLVGFSIRFAGKGIDNIFGFIGAVLALLGCLLGNFFSIVGFYAKSEGVSFLDVLSQIDFAVIPQVMIDSFSPMDVLFYGIAIYEGYKFSFREITEAEVVENS